MVALSEGPLPVPGTPHTGVPLARPVVGRRAVAVVSRATELVRPRSDLVRLLASFDHIDVLVVADEQEHDGGVVVLPVAGAELAPMTADDDADEMDESGTDLERAVAALGLPAIAVHRLGLPTTFGGEAEPDIVAALSELVGFDPEPGVYCLAPAADCDPADGAATRAAQRIARVYGLPLLTYRCLELSMVNGGAE